jgi:integrase
MKRELAAYVFSPKEPDLVPEWTPHQLRHTALTRARKEFGLEASSTFGGHRNMNVTEIYAEKNMALADTVALRSDGVLGLSVMLEVLQYYCAHGKPAALSGRRTPQQR